MPPTEPVEPEKTYEELLGEVVEEVGLYPVQAYEFIQQGLGYTVHKIHGEKKEPDTNRHVNGRALCEGLRDFALQRWGLMAGTVLKRWNLKRTMDFGRIVFALIDGGLMQKTE